jgi:argininosuccinate lyase
MTNDRDLRPSMLIRGRFKSELNSVMEQINQSILFDKRMVEQDIRCSIAHSTMLAKQGIISISDRDEILRGLEQIKLEVTENRFAYSTKLEDIHMNIESRLREVVGPVAGKLPTARSRNDQVATDFKLWVRDSIDSTTTLLAELIQILIARASENIDTILPGFTHLQIGQPVTLGHHLLAYIEMFGRDIDTLEDAKKRSCLCPLGAAALAGTHFPIDREFSAKLLGFDSPTRNSIDSVSDRDFALDYLSALTKISIHLTRLAEEIVLWTSPAFAFITMSDAWTTGSSIMPQKRNPDAAEIIRGKFGRIIGAYVALASVMKSLPLTFSKDMQEDKENTFDAYDSVTLCLKAMIGMIDDFIPNKARMLAMANAGFSTATDIADWLVRECDIPFRAAHEITGKLVALAESKPCLLSELTLEEFKAEYSGFNKSIYEFITVENSVRSKVSFGGTAPKEVAAQLEFWRGRYDEFQTR